MRNRTPKLLAFALAAVMVLGMPVSAMEIYENPEGETIDVAPEDTLTNNWGTVTYNYGEVMNNNRDVLNNYGTVSTNHGTVANNFSGGTVSTNLDTVANNFSGSTVSTNLDTVTNNNGTVSNNYYGTVTNNFSGGTVTTNQGTVTNNFSGGTVSNNYGTVSNNSGTVVNNYGGTIGQGNAPENQFYELPTPKNFSYEGEGATQANNSWWIVEGMTVTITADEGYHFASTPTTTSGTVTEVEAGKTYTLSGVTENLANGGLTLDVQEGEYTPEQPEPEPEPTPTPDPTPADTSTATEPASAPTVQQMEQRERPDPQDVEATERYNFWMGVKADLRAADDGERLRVYVPTDYTNIPASVMEQIRLLDEDITVDLRWSGEQLIITPATAQRKTALKAFWTFEQLCELYGE